MSSKFDFNEVVKIISENPEAKEIKNTFGVIAGKAQDEDQSWCYAVASDEDDECWFFEEDELEATGEFREPEEDDDPMTLAVKVNKDGEGELVRLSDYRLHVILSLRELSDKEYQKKSWLKKESKFWESIKRDLGLMIDILEIKEAPEVLMGQVFYTEEELEKVEAVLDNLVAIKELIGEERQNSDYFDSSSWGKLVRSAKVAYKLFEGEELFDDEGNAFDIEGWVAKQR